MQVPTKTEYCSACQCYVPQGVACADSECPVEDHVSADVEEEPTPVNFHTLESLREESAEYNEAYEDEREVLRELLGHNPKGEDDEYCGC